MRQIDFANAKRNFKVKPKKRKYTMKREHDSIMLSMLAGHIQNNQVDLMKRKLKDMNYFDISDPFHLDDLDGYYARCTEGEVLVFKGSGTLKDEKEDWKVNFDCKLQDTDIGRINRGYYYSLNKHYDELKSMLDDKHVLITGHSKGAAEAQIFSDMLQTRSNFQSSSVVYDPPRITDEDNVIPNNNIFIFSSSIVPRVPLKIAGYRHPGKKFYYNRKGNLVVEPKYIYRWFDFVSDLLDDGNIKESAKELATDHDIGKWMSHFYRDWDKIKDNLEIDFWEQ